MKLDLTRNNITTRKDLKDVFDMHYVKFSRNLMSRHIMSRN